MLALAYVLDLFMNEFPGGGGIQIIDAQHDERRLAHDGHRAAQSKLLLG